MRRLTLLLSLPAALPCLLSAAPTTREVTLQSADGFTLQGTLTLPEGKGKHPVVILAHQFRSDRSGWAPLAEKLQQRGVATLALDLRGHGASTQKNGATVTVSGDFDASAKTVGFDQIPDDLVIAAKWVRKQPGINGQRLALAGSSVGATSALLAAPRANPTAVLALSPGGDARALADAAGRAYAAVMVLATAEDKGAADAAAAIRPVLGACTRVYEGADHGFAMFKDHSDVMAVFLVEYLTRKNYTMAPKPEARVEQGLAPAAAPAESSK
jgi:dienelactone hydrolase